RAGPTEAHAAVGVLRAGRDPAGDGDPLTEADEARPVELRLEIAFRRAGAVGLNADAERAAGELDTAEARAGREDARAARGHDVWSTDRRCLLARHADRHAQHADRRGK